MVNLETDEVRVFKHMGYRGTANVLQNEGIKVTGARIKECCDLTKEQLNGNTYFVLDEKWCEAGDYELRKTNYIKEECIASIVGKGIQGYYEAIDILIK